MNSFPIGISALLVGRRGMDLVGQNIANATTPGYRRQTLQTTSRVTAGTGTGVEGVRLVRYDSPPLRTAIIAGNSGQADATVRLDTRRQVETALGQGENTVGGKLEKLFNAVERLTTRPSDSATRREMAAAANELAKQFNTTAGDLARLRTDVGRQATQTVTEVNSLTGRIAELNKRIYAVEVQGQQANELRDQRDQLVDDLSKKVDIRTVQQDYGVVNVIGRDTALVVSDTTNQLAMTTDTAGLLQVTVAGDPTPVRFDGGELGGLIREYNQDIPATSARLDAQAVQLAKAMDKLQATGLGTSGPLATAVGTRGVGDPTQPLATQNLPLGISAGTLTISITNTGTNARTSSAITIDPATMSLNDVAAAVTAGTGGAVTATVDPPQNVLRFQAAAGYKFDFAGRPDSPPAAEFAPPTVADTDTGGALAAFGVNSLFSGVSAGTLAVRPELVADPNLLAASRSGQSGDSSNLDRMAAVREQPLIAGRTLAQDAIDLAAAVGTQVSSLDDYQTAQAGVLKNLAAQEQAIGGVNMDEELVSLLDYQRMIEGATKFMSVVNSSLDTMFDMVR